MLLQFQFSCCYSCCWMRMLLVDGLNYGITWHKISASFFRFALYYQLHAHTYVHMLTQYEIKSDINIVTHTHSHYYAFIFTYTCICISMHECMYVRTRSTCVFLTWHMSCNAFLPHWPSFCQKKIFFLFFLIFFLPFMLKFL